MHVSRRAVPLCVLAFAACSGDPPTGPITELPRPLSQVESRIIDADNDFTFSLLRETIAREDASANVFVSPMSFAMALGMTWNGAAGATETAMQQTLGLDGLTREEVNTSYRGLIDVLRGLDRNVTFTIANSIWHKQGFEPLPEFLAANRTYFDAEVAALDFASPSASQTINGWVSEQTQGRIPTIVPAALPDDAVMYLINAIYFKANWTKRFNTDLTTSGPFHLAGGGTAQVPMMTHGEPVPVLAGNVGAVALLDLPYGGGAWRMTIAMPEQGLDSIASALTAETWNGWMAALHETSIDVFLPKFTMRYDMTQAIPVLRALGMQPAFCNDDNPDFSRIVATPPLCIFEVKHKTFVQVDEAGTEAAAATSVGLQPTSMPPQWRVDRPFIFVIRERLSGAILFIGRMMNPAAGS